MMAKKRLLANDLTSTNEPPTKKQKLMPNTSHNCKYGCGRGINPNILNKSNVCCEDCCSLNKGKLFNINSLNDDDYCSEHSCICENVQISLYDQNQYKISQKNNENNKFWLLFDGKRKYRSSGESIRFFLDLNALFSPISIQHNLYKDLRGMFVSDLYSIFIKNKQKLTNKAINEFECFFKYYQYGDCIDHAEYRGTGIYFIGFSGNNNINDMNKYRFVNNWSDYGYGLPLEFGDAPKGYFKNADSLWRLMDPLRLMFSNQNNNWNIDLLNEIQRIKTNKKDVYSDIDLSKFPNGYIVEIDEDESTFEWTEKDLFNFDQIDKQKQNDHDHDYSDLVDMNVNEWIEIYDIAKKHRRNRIEKHFHKICKVDSNILKTIIDFAI